METPSSSAGRVEIRGTRRAAPADATSTSAANLDDRTTVTVVVRARTSTASTVAALAATPPAGRTYLTREEFATRHGADPADILAVERFAIESGLIVLQADAARRAIVLEGSLGELSRAFGAQLENYTVDGQTFRGRTGAMTVPASLAPLVTGVFGLDARPQARAHFRWAARPAAAAATSFTPPQIARAYSFPTGVDGTGQTVAIIELGGGFNTSDITTYFSNLGLATPTITSVSVDGATNAPTGTPDSADGEVALDIEVIGAIAPGAKIVVYFGPNTDQGFLDAITTAVHDTANKPTIVSISWGGPESTWTAQALSNLDGAFADAATLGVTVCIAAGDNGSSDGLTDGLAHVDFPASSPHVLACGGTSLAVSGTTITSETVWNDGTSGGATGGGVSDTFALPAYQQNAGVPPSANAGGHVGRGVPDVAGDADPQTGYDTLVDGESGVVGGTSAVAPLWSALTALINQKNGVQLGFFNAQLYAQGTAATRDITSGNNGAYSAGPGWDACTGLGSPNGTKLATALASPGTITGTGAAGTGSSGTTTVPTVTSGDDDAALAAAKSILED